MVNSFFQIKSLVDYPDYMEYDDKTDIKTTTQNPVNTTTPKPVITTTQKYSTTTSKNIALPMTTEDENDLDGADDTLETSTIETSTIDSMALANKNETSNTGALAVVVCCMIALLLSSLLITCCVCKCRSRSQGNSPTGFCNPLYTGPQC